jgi:Protein of unknown function (DUF3768)
MQFVIIGHPCYYESHENKGSPVNAYHNEKNGNSVVTTLAPVETGPIFNTARYSAWRDVTLYTASDDQRARIAALNDEARVAMGIACTLAATPGFLKLSRADQSRICELVQGYDAWNIGTDTYEERDFGILFQFADSSWTTDTPDGSGWLGAVFWKIDYFDISYSAPSKRPWDKDVTARVLTLMRPDEY